MPLSVSIESAWASLKLTVDLSAVGGAWSVTVTRTNADGTLHIVRSGDRVVMPGGVGLVYDHEAPLGTNVNYSAQAYNSAGAAVGAAAVNGPVAVPTTTVEKAWVKAVDNPSLSRALQVSVNGPWTRGRKAEEFTVLGRTMPVVHSSGIAGRKGSLQVVALTSADIAAVEALFGQDRLLVQWPPALLQADLYAAVGDVEPAPVGPRGQYRMRFTVPLTETDRPATVGYPLRIPGSSWDTVRATWATWNAVVAARTTWNDLADG